jgi:HK97 family phage portal protein
MRQRTVWSCVRIIASVVAQFPLPVYQKDESGKKTRLDQHPLYRILNRAPNERMTAFHFRQTLMSHLLTWGNAYAFVDRDNAGRVKSLWPLLPDRTRPALDDNGKLVYLTRIKNDPNGISSSDNQQLVLQPDDVLHIPGLSFDGLKGYSVVSQLREDIGLGLAMTEYAARFFGNGAIPGFVLQTENNLSPEQKTMLKAAWEEGHQGLINANRVAILERGLKVEKISIPPEDAQFLESRQFNKEEIAEIFGVPLHLLGASDKTSGAWSGVEQLSLQFLQYTINPILENWQQSIDVRLFSKAEQANTFVEFITADILRSDLKTRFDAYRQLLGLALTANDVRRMENLAPWPNDEGEVKYLPPGAVPLSIALNPPAPVVPAPPGGDPTGPEPKSATFDVRKPVERLLRDVLEQTVKRERVDMVKKKKYDGDDIRTFLGGKLKPIVEAFPESVDETWADSVVRSHVGESVTLLGDGGEIGIEAAFGTSVNRVARETAAALALLPANTVVAAGTMVMLGEFAPISQVGDMDRQQEEQILQLMAGQQRLVENAQENQRSVIRVLEGMAQPPAITIQSAPTPNVEVKLEPVINVAAPDATAFELVYEKSGPRKGALKGQRPVKELKD